LAASPDEISSPGECHSEGEREGGGGFTERKTESHYPTSTNRNGINRK